MSLARLVFVRRSVRLAHQNQLVLYRPGLAANAAGQKPACWPRSRGALPPGVTVFANARINKTTSYPCIAPRVQKHAPPRSCGNMHIPPNVSHNTCYDDKFLTHEKNSSSLDRNTKQSLCQFPEKLGGLE